MRSLTMKKFTIMKFTMKSLTILTILRESFTTPLGTHWRLLTIMDLTTRSITMGKSCTTHLVIRNTSLVSNMRSTDSQLHAEPLTPVMSLTIVDLNLTILNLTTAGGFQHAEEGHSQGVGAARAATCWALPPSRPLD